MMTAPTVLAALGTAVPRPALRLGGEWAGWRCAFHPRSGALLTQLVERHCSEEMIEWGQVPGGFEEVTTEICEDGRTARRSVMLLPEDGCNTENLAAVVSHSTLRVSGRTPLDVNVLNAKAWALVDDGREPEKYGGRPLWRCETLFDGLGGERPRLRRGALECPMERTRVSCVFDPITGELVAEEPVIVWQERCWSANPSDDLTVQESSGCRSGLDAAWVASVVGLSCFGELECAAAAGHIASADAELAGARGALPTNLAVGGGVALHGRPGLLEVSLTVYPSASGPARTTLRHSWEDGVHYGVESK